MEKKKHAGGRPPKYKKEFVEQAGKLCLLGAIDKDLADFFKVDIATINRWKEKYPEFCDTLKQSKDDRDERVERSLLERASGYSHMEDKIFYDSKIGKTVIEPTIKHYPPDTTAMIFWLKNRQPKKWRDKQEIDLSGSVNISFDSDDNEL